MVQSFKEVVAIWDSPGQMAEAIGAKAARVQKWRQRDSIPADWWVKIIQAAQVRGATITTDRLAAIAARQQVTE